VDDAEGAALLLDAEPVGPVRSVGGLVDSGCDLLLEYVDDLVEDTGRDGYVSSCPWDVLDGRDLDRCEVVIAKLSAFGFGPRECVLIGFEDVLRKV
jgi:hypothetical protein